MERSDGLAARSQPRRSWEGCGGRSARPGTERRSLPPSYYSSSDVGVRARQPAKKPQWEWDAKCYDWVREIGGELVWWTEYCTSAARRSALGISQPGPSTRPITPDDAACLIAPCDGAQEDSPGKHEPQSPSAAPDEHQPQSPDLLPAGPLRPYDLPLDPRFRIVEKPKRFFTVGRIFKTVWFEPGGAQDPDPAAAAVDSADWSSSVPPFHSEIPSAKFRWFVVVRKRLHHSLCFAITTSFGGGRRGHSATSSSTRRTGRARDFVVLYPAVVEPPDPWPEEGIEREPLAVIIEEGQQFLSPAARVDCGRIYTVEDDLRVMKIGRIHPDSLAELEAYYCESVE